VYLVDWIDDPVDAGVSANSLVLGIDEYDLVVLVGGVLVNPVGVKDAEVGTAAADTFLGSGSERTLIFQLVHTLVGRLACGRKVISVLVFNDGSQFSHTICSTLWYWSLAASTANADTVNDISLFGLVSKTASLVRA
jgi:hypothetical protein